MLPQNHFQKEKNWRNWNVAVTGMNASPESPGPGFAVARSIREHRHFDGRIIGLGYDVLDAGLYSKTICNGGYLIPYPSAGRDALLERIYQVHALEGLDAIIPCLDAELQNFIGIQNELKQLGIKMLIPTREQFTLRAKDHLAEFCRSIGVDAPETKTITNPLFFDECEAQGWQYPLMVKGIFYDATVARNAYEAKAIFAKLVQSWGYPVLVQKIIPGDEYDLAAIGDGHCRMLGAVMMRKRGLTDKGKAWAGVTVVDEAIGKVAEKIIRGLAWRGPLEVEVMKGYDGKIYLIEINPRFPAWIYLSHAVGRNLPAALLQTLANEPELDLSPPKPGTFFIRHAQELIVELAEFESLFVNGGISTPIQEEYLEVNQNEHDKFKAAS